MGERATFGPYYRALSAMAEKGHCRRGYFVAGMGGAQFGSTSAIDLSRTIGMTNSSRFDPSGNLPVALVTATADPVNPYGAALAWPDLPTKFRPGRKDSSIVVLVQAQPAIYHERGGASLLVWPLPSRHLRSAAAALVKAVDDRRIPALIIKRINGESYLGHEFADILADAGAYRTPSTIRIRPG